MAITRLGYDTVDYQDAESGSASITVPTACDFAIAWCNAYNANLSDNFTADFQSIAGSAMTNQAQSPYTVDSEQQCVSTLVNPTVGSTSYSWDLAGRTIDYGIGNALIVYYSGIDTTDPVIDATASATANDITGLSPGDLVVGDCISDVSGDTNTAGQTSVFSGAIDTSGYGYHHCAENWATSASAFYAQGALSYETVSALSLRAAAAGVTSTASPAAESLSVSGPIPDLEVEVELSPDLEALVVDGLLPTISTSSEETALPDREQLTVDGFTPVVVGERTAAPATEALDVLGIAPTISYEVEQSAAPATEILDVTEYVPFIARDIAALPTVEALDIGTYIPGIDYDVETTASPDTEALTIGGPIPTITEPVGVAIEVVRVACDTALGTQDITTASLGGITPVGAMFIGCYATVDDTVTAHSEICIGWTDGTNQNCTLGYDQDAQATTDTRRTGYDDRCVQINTPGTAAGNYGTGVFSAFIENGVRVNWTTACNDAYLLTVVLFGGEDVSAHVGSFTSGALSTATYSSATFAFDAAFFATPARLWGATSTPMRYGIGFCGSNTTQTYLTVNSDDGAGTSNLDGYVRDDNAIGCDGGGGPSFHVEIISITSTGFTYLPKVASVSDDVGFLLIETGGGVKVGQITTPTTSGTASVTGVGFRPQCVIALPNMHTAVNSTASATAIAGVTGVSVFTDSAEYAVSFYSEHGVGTSDTNSLNDDRAVRLYEHDASATAFVGSLVSMDSDGFTIDWDEADGTARYWPYIAFEGVTTEYTLTPDRESLTITGYAPGLIGEQVAQPSREALDVTEYAPSVTTEVTAQPAREALTIDGRLPSIATSEGIQPITESLTVDGYQAVIARDIPAQPGTEELTIDGYQVSISEALTVTPDTQALTVEGQAPSVSIYVPGVTNLAVTRVAADTAGGAQTITATLNGVIPKAVLFIGSTGITDGVAAADYSFMVGATDGTNDVCIHGGAEDNSNPSNTRRQGWDDRCICFLDPGNTANVGYATFDSFVANGVTINWTSTPVAAHLITCVFFAGSTLEAHVGTTTTAGINTATYSSAPFAFNAGFFISPARTIGASSSPLFNSFGMCDGDLNQVALSMRDDESASPTAVAGELRNDSVLAISNKNSLRYRDWITEITASGFKHIASSYQGDTLLFLLLNYGKSVTVGTYDSPTSTGDYSLTGLGYKPEMVIDLMTMYTTLNTHASDSQAGGYGLHVTTPNDEFMTVWTSEDATATSNTKGISDDAILLTDDTGTNTFVGSFQTMTNDGWTYNYTTADGTTRKWGYMALQGEADVALPGADSHTISGHKPAVLDASVVYVNPQTESLSIAGYVPGYYYGIDPPTDALTVTGYVPRLVPTVLGYAQLSITGYVPKVNYPLAETQAARVRFTGYPPTWQGVAIAPSEAVLEVDTYAPVVVAASNVAGFFWERLPDPYTE